MLHLPIKSVKLFVRYKHYDILNYRFRDVDEAISSTIDEFKYFLNRYPGIAGAIGYGKSIRPDLKAWIILEVTDNKDTLHKFEFENAGQLARFLDEEKEIGEVLGYKGKK